MSDALSPLTAGMCLLASLFLLSQPSFSGTPVTEHTEPLLQTSVVLLHGLNRSPWSMRHIEHALLMDGYRVHNLAYPSRETDIVELSRQVREKMVEFTAHDEKVHVVTHSMGGILIRIIQKHRPLENLGRVVMLGPPNQGSEVVDHLGNLRLFEAINGPSGRQLGTDPSGLIHELGPVDFELGVISGDRSVNIFLSNLIPGPDDGKVSVENTQVDGMQDFKLLHVTHPFMLSHQAVIRDILSFLRKGAFEHD